MRGEKQKNIQRYSTASYMRHLSIDKELLLHAISSFNMFIPFFSLVFEFSPWYQAGEFPLLN